MLNIDSIQNGVVIDHLKAGTSLQIYNLLELDSLDCGVAIIRNTRSSKLGRKDIIKIEGEVDIDFDVLGYIDHNITIDVIRNGKIVEKKQLLMPRHLKNVIRCKNPRCISSIEEEIDQLFDLSANGKYRCAYCEQEFTVAP
ncbi:MAG: aspartate carbamoyltransferase regulatory subunit [Oscillospiraceae bacterium]